jgi:thymidylate synthase
MLIPFLREHANPRDHQHPEEQYLELLRKTLSGDEQIDNGTGVKTYSVFGAQMRFDLTQNFPLLTTKRVYWKGVLHELYWFMSGQSNIKYLVDNDVHIWDDYPYKIYIEKNPKEKISKDEFIAKIKSDAEFARVHGELPHIYGELWRRWGAKDGRRIDQLQWVVDELRKDPDAHNTLVTSWNPEYLYSMAAPGTGARFPICHNMYQVNIKRGRVCLQLYQRSADIFLGVPFNIASYALLTAILAKILGREAGEFIHTFGDFHMYENHREQLLEQLARTPRTFPTISFTKDFRTLEEFRPEFVKLDGYDPHATIKAELTVAGGFNKKLHDTNSL